MRQASISEGCAAVSGDWGGGNGESVEDGFGPGHSVERRHWLAGIRDTVRRHEGELAAYDDHGGRFKRVVELNVLRQVYNLSRTPIVQNAWKRGRRPLLHGIVYDMHDGLLREQIMQVDTHEKARALLESDRRSIGY